MMGLAPESAAAPEMELSTVSDVWDGDADNESVLGEMGDTAVLGATATSWREPLRSERKAKLKAKQKEKAGQVPFHQQTPRWGPRRPNADVSEMTFH